MKIALSKVKHFSAKKRQEMKKREKELHLANRRVKEFGRDVDFGPLYPPTSNNFELRNGSIILENLFFWNF